MRRGLGGGGGNWLVIEGGRVGKGGISRSNILCIKGESNTYIYTVHKYIQYIYIYIHK